MLETTAKNASGAGGCGYFAHLNGWSASWLSFEHGGGGEIEILVQRTSKPINRATVQPSSAGARVTSVGADGARILVSAAARFNLELDDGLGSTDTGPSYQGPAMHTFAVFAEPLEASPPQQGQCRSLLGASR